MLDPESIRVDLLKFRQKAYLSYPEGSEERKKFLKTILQNELRLVKQDVPSDLINFLMEGKREVLGKFLKSALIWGGSFLISFSAFVWLIFLHSIYFTLFIFPMSYSVIMIVQHLSKYFTYRKSMKYIEKYSSDMKQYIGKIYSDIRKLDGPRGL
jgi:hypothetical protein